MSPVASSDRRTASLLLVAAVFTAIVVAVVTPARAGDAPATSANAAPEIPLPELPTLRSADLPKASREAVKGLETRLEELVNTPVDGPLAKLEDRLLVADLDDEMVPAIAERLARLKDELDGDGASRVLEKGREVGRKAIRSYRKEHDLKKKDPDPPYDWLVFVLSLGDSADDTWRGSVELYGMLRMLEAIGTTPAVRVMIEAFPTRIDYEDIHGRYAKLMGDEILKATGDEPAAFCEAIALACEVSTRRNHIVFFHSLISTTTRFHTLAFFSSFS